MSDCPLCGYTVTDSQKMTACRGCPFGKGCELTCCPQCGYQWPETSVLVTWWRRWRNRLTSHAHARH